MKQKILRRLYEHKGNFLSGQEIAQDLGLSRESISQYIKRLKEDGYSITSKTRQGYCLDASSDVLIPEIIQEGLHPFYTLDVRDGVTSTNDLLKQNVSALPEGTVLIADHQEKGRGRNDRSFYSPKQDGMYLSILLRPRLPWDEVMKITACTSVALAQTIETLYRIQPQIKWINDVLIDYKKVAGILCEAGLDLETQKLDYVIIGVGLNVHSHPFPKELSSLAGCVEDFTEQRIERNVIIRHFLNSFYSYVQTLESNAFLPLYKDYSCILGKEITVMEPHRQYQANAIDIDDNARLIIEKNGQLIPLSSGEISIRNYQTK